MTIAISIERILDSIYAFCALDCATAASPRPSLPGLDDAPALRRLIRTNAASTVYRLHPQLSSPDLDRGPEEDIITIDVADTVPADKAAMLRPTLEAALATGAMSVLWAGVDSGLAATYGWLSAEAASALASSVRDMGLPGRIEAA